jgi:hypothetical protein
MDLFELMEPFARERQLLGSFSLVVVTSVFMIPYERMKGAHPLNKAGQGDGLYAAIRRVERQPFCQAEFWNGEQNRHWQFSRIMNDANWTQGWRDEDDLHPMRPDAANTIDRRAVNDVLRVVRNALAHGNVVYLDEQGLETKGAQVQYLAFLSRYEETPEQREQEETYRLAVTTEEGFLSFVKAWATWLAALPADQRLAEATE